MIKILRFFFFFQIAYSGDCIQCTCVHYVVSKHLKNGDYQVTEEDGRTQAKKGGNEAG